MRPRKNPSRWPAIPTLPEKPGRGVPSMCPTPRLSESSSVPARTGTSSSILGMRRMARGAAAKCCEKLASNPRTRSGDHSVRSGEPTSASACGVLPTTAGPTTAGATRGRDRQRRAPGHRPAVGRPGNRRVRPSGRGPRRRGCPGTSRSRRRPRNTARSRGGAAPPDYPRPLPVRKAMDSTMLRCSGFKYRWRKGLSTDGRSQAAPAPSPGSLTIRFLPARLAR